MIDDVLGNHRILAQRKLIEELGPNPAAIDRFSLISAKIVYAPSWDDENVRKALIYGLVDNKDFQMKTSLVDVIPVLRDRRAGILRLVNGNLKDRRYAEWRMRFTAEVSAVTLQSDMSKQQRANVLKLVELGIFL